MATLGELKALIGRMLSDPAFTGYTEALVIDGVCAALDAILPWMPKTEVYSIVGDGSKNYALPADLYAVEACVVDSTGEILPHAVLIPGNYLGDNISGNNDWIEFPHGNVSFSKAIGVGETYSLYYLAHWTKPTIDSSNDFVIEAPDSCTTGLVLYASAYSIFPSAISIAEIRQFNTKVDSGVPEQNPMQKAANYLLQLFTTEMGRHPKHQKAER